MYITNKDILGKLGETLSDFTDTSFFFSLFYEWQGDRGRYKKTGIAHFYYDFVFFC